MLIKLNTVNAQNTSAEILLINPLYNVPRISGCVRHLLIGHICISCMRQKMPRNGEAEGMRRFR